MMVLKRLLLSDTKEVLDLHIHCSGLLRKRALNQYDSFSGKMVLKRLLLVDTGEASSLQIHCSGLQRDRALSHSFQRVSSHSAGRQGFELIE